MPSALPRAPRYCRQKENGRPDRAYCTIDGKRVVLGNYGTPESYKKYAQLMNGELRAEKPVVAPAAPVLPTVAMLMADYLAYAVRKYGGEKALEVVHCKNAFRILRQTHGELLAKDFGPKAYKAMRMVMIEANWSRGYIREQCQRIKRMIAWGVSEEMLPSSAKHALDAVPGLTAGEFGVRETRDVPPVSDDTVAATLACLGATVADMVRIQKYTGMRPGEVVQLSSQHIDRKGDVWMFAPPQHKNKKRGKHRIIAIGPKAQAVLGKYLFADPCFQYTSASYRRAIKRGCDRAFPHPELSAIPKKKLTATQLAELTKWRLDHRWSPNQLRHAAATMIRQQFGLEHAQVALGHSQSRTTEIYALPNHAKAVEVALRIG